MRILVTGGAGFIGSYVVHRLVADGHTVTVLDNLSTGVRATIDPDVEIIVEDIRNRAALAAMRLEFDAVIHLAAMVSVSGSVADPRLCREINVDGTRNIFEAALSWGARRVVIASTAAVYGNNQSLPKREILPPEPASPYAYSKWTNEIDAQYYSEYLQCETVGLRFFNVYGPRQRPDSPYAGVISIAADRILNGLPFTIYGDGLQTRDFIYVQDVADCVVEAATRDGLKSSVVNVGCGERITILDLVACLERATGQTAVLEFGPARLGDVRHSVAYVGRMRSVLNARPKVRLLDGLKSTIVWMKDQMREFD